MHALFLDNDEHAMLRLLSSPVRHAVFMTDCKHGLQYSYIRIQDLQRVIVPCYLGIVLA